MAAHLNRGECGVGGKKRLADTHQILGRLTQHCSARPDARMYEQAVVDAIAQCKTARKRVMRR